MKKIAIHTEYIKLDQFLKLADIIGSGGEAKIYILENTILVNGEDEKRRGKKLRDGDTVEIKGKKYIIEQAGEEI